jgi:hypothetical protein
MQVTITNAGSEDIFVSLLYKQLTVGESVTVSKSVSELDQELEFKKLVQAGTLVLSFTKEDGDEAAVGAQEVLPVFTNATRGAASAWPAFTPIWNSDDNAPNWSDGTVWRASDGTIT